MEKYHFGFKPFFKDDEELKVCHLGFMMTIFHTQNQMDSLHDTDANAMSIQSQQVKAQPQPLSHSPDEEQRESKSKEMLKEHHVKNGHSQENATELIKDEKDECDDKTSLSEQEGVNTSLNEQEGVKMMSNCEEQQHGVKKPSLSRDLVVDAERQEEVTIFAKEYSIETREVNETTTEMKNNVPEEELLTEGYEEEQEFGHEEDISNAVEYYNEADFEKEQHEQQRDSSGGLVDDLIRSIPWTVDAPWVPPGVLLLMNMAFGLSLVIALMLLMLIWQETDAQQQGYVLAHLVVTFVLFVAMQV